MNTNGSRLHEWLHTSPNLKVYNSPHRTSIRSQGIINQVISSIQLSVQSTDINPLMTTITDHYPVHSNHCALYEVNKHIDWRLVHGILELKQSFFFHLAQCMKNTLTDFILLYEKFLVALQDRCTHYDIITKYRPIVYLFI